jgi:hypothetical protein
VAVNTLTLFHFLTKNLILHLLWNWQILIWTVDDW